jgi:ribose transport system ATP-binding protein
MGTAPPIASPISSDDPVNLGSPLLEVRGLVKEFGGTRAVDHVDLDVEAGEIHALLGENGAGKSTVIKILAGLYPPDAGEVRLKGEHVAPTSDRLPIGFIHQDLALVDSMTVAENIGLVAGYPGSNPLISWSRLRAFASDALARTGSEIDPETLVSSLPHSAKSIVAIARALAMEVRLLVLDEPTAALPADDAEHLFRTLDGLRSTGVGIVYVTHRLDEVSRLADRVTVLRDGRRVATSRISEVTVGEIVRQIVGKSPAEVFPRVARPGERPLLELKDVQTAHAGPVSLSVRAGEILALVGLRGAGQESIGRALFGEEPILSGVALSEDGRHRPKTPSDAIGAGFGFISSKRAEESVAATLTVAENLYLNPTLNAPPGVRTGSRTERAWAADVARQFDIRPADPEALVATLSGGNQQKVVLARWLMANCKLLILEEPTAGIDIGAKSEVYSSLGPLLDAGGAVLLVSSDFEEVAQIASRAVVFHAGRIAAELCQGDLTQEVLTEVAGAGRNGTKELWNS